jgi:type I restriction enzyme R subunit
MGFSLASGPAKPLLMRYLGGEATRRYYQDAAIRSVLEKLARGEKRALLTLATGAGKTFRVQPDEEDRRFESQTVSRHHIS